MFGKKKNDEAINQYDAKMRELRNELAKIGSKMNKKVKDVYVKTQAVTLYLGGTSDWEIACTDRYETQQSLHRLIEVYNNKRDEIIRYTEENGDKFELCWSKVDDSHTWIETSLKHFLEKW